MRRLVLPFAAAAILAGVAAQASRGPDAEALAQRAVDWIKPLIARTAGIINGAGDGAGTQAAVDALLGR